MYCACIARSYLLLNCRCRSVLVTRLHPTGSDTAKFRGYLAAIIFRSVSRCCQHIQAAACSNGGADAARFGDLLLLEWRQQATLDHVQILMFVHTQQVCACIGTVGPATINSLVCHSHSTTTCSCTGNDPHAIHASMHFCLSLRSIITQQQQQEQQQVLHPTACTQYHLLRNPIAPQLPIVQAGIQYHAMACVPAGMVVWNITGILMQPGLSCRWCAQCLALDKQCSSLQQPGWCTWLDTSQDNQTN